MDAIDCVWICSAGRSAAGVGAAEVGAEAEAAGVAAAVVAAVVAAVAVAVTVAVATAVASAGVPFSVLTSSAGGTPAGVSVAGGGASIGSPQ
jgi:hypothetical protein